MTLTFVLTGTLSDFRSNIKARIHALGGKVVGSASSKVDYVVAGNDVLGTTKLRAAEAMGIPVISEKQLWPLLGTRAPRRGANKGRVVKTRIYVTPTEKRKIMRRKTDGGATTRKVVKRRRTQGGSIRALTISAVARREAARILRESALRRQRRLSPGAKSTNSRTRSGTLKRKVILAKSAPLVMI